MSVVNTVLLLVIFSVGQTLSEYILTANPSQVEFGITEQLTLDCRFRGGSSSLQSDIIAQVRILKEMEPDNFTIVAEVKDSAPELVNVGLGPSANISGLVADVASSYLSIHWKQATPDILGRYRCDVVGFKANQDPYIDRTAVLVLKQSNLTVENVVDFIVRQKAELETKLQDQKVYCDNKLAVVESSIHQILEAIRMDQENSSQQFQQHLLELTAVLEVDVARLMETGVLQYWPQGTYALLMPDSDCPNNAGAVWQTGIVVFHTESTDRNYDEVSTPSHLAPPALQRNGFNNFITQQFCVSSDLSPGADWPRGAYCINRVGNVCPSGFGSGYISWQNEVTGSQSSSSGKLPDGVYTLNETIIDYCCRNDGDHQEPIYLPRARPFYLYRYNGTCQQVVGMQASPEFVTFDTDNSNQDAYENQFHPDGAINNVHIELCYYTQT
ncbi:unnamed protein product [Candidula unifasciata]|uniref:Apextrin C-terminal domain-containing protein n=1 Tax=Candidula unifasciata TaxID=100452 RepID=A0A8S3YYD6_9EUPU|nr:unnamed protein product [Candidula unifasciata]